MHFPEKCMDYEAGLWHFLFNSVIFPTHFEGFGEVLVMYMSFQCAIYASRCHHVLHFRPSMGNKLKGLDDYRQGSTEHPKEYMLWKTCYQE